MVVIIGRGVTRECYFPAAEFSEVLPGSITTRMAGVVRSVHVYLVARWGILSDEPAGGYTGSTGELAAWVGDGSQPHLGFVEAVVGAVVVHPIAAYDQPVVIGGVREVNENGFAVNNLPGNETSGAVPKITVTTVERRTCGT